MLARRQFDVERLHILAFTGKRAAAEFIGHPVGHGPLPAAGRTRLFVLPSPSGAARRHWNVDYWRQLAALRAAIR